MNGKKWILGIILLSSTAFWLCSLRIFMLQPLQIPALFFLLVTVGLTLLLFRKSDYTVDRKWSVLFIVSVLSSLLIWYPYNVGLMLLAIGFLLLAVFPRFWLGVTISGLILTLQAGILGVYYMLIPSGHSATILSYVVYPFIRVFGYTATLDKGVIYILQAEDVFPFPTTWDTLGIYPFILIFVPVLCFLLLTSETVNEAVRRAVGSAALGLVYLLFRYVILIHFFFSGSLGVDAVGTFRELFFSPLSMALSFVPFVCILFFVYPFSLEVEFPTFSVEKRLLTLCGVLFVSSFLLVGAFTFQDPGVEKKGRVLVDEIHSTWEPSSLILDKEWYGSESTYNAYSMIEWFKVSYDVDRVMSPAYVDWNPGEHISKTQPDIVSDEITAEMLSNYDILILKTPAMYTEKEVEAIVNFVENGGGLFVIGDHSNFSGTSTALNEIIRHFGMQLEFDSVNTAEGRLSTYERGRIAHSSAKYMPYFDFLTSCSITAPMSVGRIIPGYGLMAEPGEYASTGFFRETRRDLSILATDRTWGIFHQSVAGTYGKGRIAIFADSTTISNFRIFFGGSPNLVIGCMEYLNYANKYQFVTKLFLAGGVILAASGVYLFGKLEKKLRLGIFLVLVCAMGLGSGLSAAVFSPTLYSTIPAKYYDWETTVCFDGKHSSEIVNSGDREGVYTNFLIWTQRVGLVPTIELSLEECVQKGKTIVIIDPVKEGFSQKEVELLKEHVKKGGNVLMMVDQPQVLGLNLIKEFDLEIEAIMKPYDAPKEEVLFAPWGPSIKGGEALKKVEERVILARVSYGEGYFVLCTVSHAFRDGFGGQPGYMGYNGSDPDILEENQKAQLWELYNLEFELFEQILKV